MLTCNEVVLGTLQHEMCLIFNYIVGAKVALPSISKDMDNCPSSNFNEKFVVRGAIGNNSLALW